MGVPEYKCSRIQGFHENTEVPEYRVSKIQGLQNIKGFLNTGFPKYRGSRIQGFQNTGVTEYRGSRIQGFQNTGVPEIFKEPFSALKYFAV